MLISLSLVCAISIVSVWLFVYSMLFAIIFSPLIIVAVPVDSVLLICLLIVCRKESTRTILNSLK